MQLDTILDYTYDVNYSVQKGECLELGMCLPLSYCMEYEDHIGASNTIPFEMESVDIDGEGRIYHTSTSGFKYDCYLKDHLGSTRMVVNDENVVTEAFAYQPYGTIIPLEDIVATPQTPTRQQFTGKEFDREGEDSENGVSGIQAYYFGARYFDPEVGVWMSTDPKNQFFNPFAYSTNPINTVDPDGQWALALVAAAQWYISGVMSHGEINPGKWDWSDPGLWISTATAAFTIGMDLGNDIATIVANRSKIINDYSAFGTDGGYASASVNEKGYVTNIVNDNCPECVNVYDKGGKLKRVLINNNHKESPISMGDRILFDATSTDVYRNAVKGVLTDMAGKNKWTYTFKESLAGGTLDKAFWIESIPGGYTHASLGVSVFDNYKFGNYMWSDILSHRFSYETLRYASEMNAMLNSRRQNGLFPLPNLPFGRNQFFGSYDNMFDQIAIVRGYYGH